MAQSVYVQNRNRVNAGLRAARRLYRSADSAGEALERSLDRLIKRKTLIYPDQIAATVALYRKYQQLMNALEKGLADAVTIASF